MVDAMTVTVFVGPDVESASFSAKKNSAVFLASEFDQALSHASAQTLFGDQPIVTISDAESLTAAQLREINTSSEKYSALRLLLQKKPSAVFKRNLPNADYLEFKPPAPSQSAKWVKNTANELYGFSISDAVAESIGKAAVKNIKSVHEVLRLLSYADKSLQPKWNEYIRYPTESEPIWKCADYLVAGNWKELINLVDKESPYAVATILGNKTALCLSAASGSDLNFPTLTPAAISSAKKQASTKSIKTWVKLHSILTRAALEMRSSGILELQAKALLILAIVDCERVCKI